MQAVTSSGCWSRWRVAVESSSCLQGGRSRSGSWWQSLSWAQDTPRQGLGIAWLCSWEFPSSLGFQELSHLLPLAGRVMRGQCLSRFAISEKLWVAHDLFFQHGI